MLKMLIGVVISGSVVIALCVPQIIKYIYRSAGQGIIPAGFIIPLLVFFAWLSPFVFVLVALYLCKAIVKGRVFAWFTVLLLGFIDCLVLSNQQRVGFREYFCEGVLDACRRVTPPEGLQEWSLGILNGIKSNTVSYVVNDELTPPPFPLPHYNDLRPSITAWPAEGNKLGVVNISWGGGFLHWGVEIGAPGFRRDNPESVIMEWRSGIYVFCH